jgi:hypothetical protein
MTVKLPQALVFEAALAIIWHRASSGNNTSGRMFAIVGLGLVTGILNDDIWYQLYILISLGIFGQAF